MVLSALKMAASRVCYAKTSQGLLSAVQRVVHFGGQDFLQTTVWPLTEISARIDLNV